MDRPQPVSAELIADLRNLRAAQSLLRKLPSRPTFLCAAGFGLTTAARCSISPPDRAISRGWWSISPAKTGRDSCRSTRSISRSRRLQIARGLSADYPEITFHCADIASLRRRAGLRHRALLARSASFRRSGCRSRSLRRCRALSRGKVLVADLRRGWLAQVGRLSSDRR